MQLYSFQETTSFIMNQIKLDEPVSNPMWHPEIFHTKFSPNICNSSFTRKCKSSTSSSTKCYGFNQSSQANLYLFWCVSMSVYIYICLYICDWTLDHTVLVREQMDLSQRQQRLFFFSNDFSSEEKNKPSQNKKK